MILAEVKETLRTRKSNLHCKEVKALLESLGFEVRDGKRGGHKLYFHDDLPKFTSGSYNCGHGKNPEIKSAYIAKIIRVLEMQESDLKLFLKKGNEQ